MIHPIEPDIYVGLDYHSKTVQAAILNGRGDVLANRSLANDVDAVAAFCGRHGRVRGVAIEACCGAADFAHKLIENTGWSTDLAHPGFVSRMKQSPDKTDYSDALVLADLSRVGYLPRVWLAPTYIRELRLLDSARDASAIDIRRTKQRIRAVLREQRIQKPDHVGKPWTLSWLAWLRDEAPLSAAARVSVSMELERFDLFVKQRRDIERQLRKATKDDPVFAALKAEHGIGEVIAWKFRARIGRFDRFRSGKQLARFCGLSPRNASSGQRQSDSGLIHTCDKPMRAMILQAAHQLRQRNRRWSALYGRLMSRGAKANVAVAAVANRWLRGLFHRMKEVSMSAS